MRQTKGRADVSRHIDHAQKAYAYTNEKRQTTRAATHLHRVRSSRNHFHEIWSVCKHAAEVLFETVLPVGSRTRIHFEAYPNCRQRVLKPPEMQRGKRQSFRAMYKTVAITCNHAARVLGIRLVRDEGAALKRRDTPQLK
jgi:hypothetical protein